MSFARFKREAAISRQDICREMLASHRAAIKIQKEEVAIRNLERIYDATLRVSNQKGFQAMTMRDLSRASGLSMGALYDHLASKEELLEMIQSTGRRLTSRILKESYASVEDPGGKLAAAIRTHLYLSEAMQPWFFFSYMEARHLGDKEKQLAKQSEQRTERVFAGIIRQGNKQGAFNEADPNLTAAVIKAMVQDWYLKRWKYAKRRISVDRYADFVIKATLGCCAGINGAGKEAGA
ncbi:MAG: TetR/AcrR family transcriptional regulator [Desulfarculaceae bacterium]|nr:TetR/AcrR family transcriptional regulator [Desulfarculaceae bacterium]MCF8071687.1 TetR/AcrR family transcriptional regulator [Desulfarculaceae bacterium]MCF8102466.1 TetR/AcrR family transcriptional regulator [Desulfarculaceae bacterium]MCF8116808.1 TetR/AcrR family transcriptional regulator [Desulfarculaceae bacterium]